MAGCYEPKEGCLDIAGTNFDASADDPCNDCCLFPKLTLVVQHEITLPTLPDTLFPFKYKTPYPSPFDPTHYFQFERSRYLISDLKLVRSNGEAVEILDTIELEAPTGALRTVRNSFAKIDRDIFTASTVGTMITKGAFTSIAFTLGLEGPLQQTNPSSVPANHPLSTTSDTLIYKTGFGYVPNLLILKKDTLPETQPLELRLTETTNVSLPLEKPFEVLEGFNLKLALKVDYAAWMEGIDLKNDSAETIREKIVENLPKAFSVSNITLE